MPLFEVTVRAVATVSDTYTIEAKDRDEAIEIGQSKVSDDPDTFPYLPSGEWEILDVIVEK